MHADLTLVARDRETLADKLTPLSLNSAYFRLLASEFDRATQAQFLDLAESIAKAVGDVKRAIDERFRDLDRAAEGAAEAAAELSSLAARQQAETGRMLADTRAQLAAMEDVLRSSEAFAREMTGAGANINEGVGQAIVALQCQDMARQKFEHICAAIDEMAAELPAEGLGGRSEAEQADGRRFFADASRVQLSQVRGVFEQLAEAARQVRAGMSDVETEARSLTRIAVGSGEAMLDTAVMEGAGRSMEALLPVLETAVNSVAGVVRSVAGIKATFRNCTDDIRTLTLRLRMIALNAQILASQVANGACLEVVSRNTRLTADECLQQLDGISTRVNANIDAAGNLEQCLQDYTELAALERQTLVSEALESKSKLWNLNRDLRRALDGIGLVERDLTATIDRLQRAITFPALAVAAGQQAEALFEELAGLESAQPGHLHEKVERLKRNYTMWHERTVHDAVVGAEAPTLGEVVWFDEPEGVAPLAEGAVPDEEALPENVELF